MSTETLQQLDALVDGWAGLAEILTLADVRHEQAPPWASISQGAAGNAYALWHIGSRRSTPGILRTARRWWRFAVRGAERRSGFRSGAFDGIALAGSVVFGRPGLHVVDALIAHDHGEPRARERALARLHAVLHRDGAIEAEHMTGRAGALIAALHVAQVTGDDRMRALADVLAERLLDAAPIDVKGFAHGRVGVQHALLAWAQRTGHPLPDDFVAQIVCPTNAEIIARTPSLAGTWCNGLTGFVMLWVKAFELTGDERWRRRAIEAARALAELPVVSGTLCCGLGGQAYALLALSRIDHSEDWRAGAIGLCTRGIGIAEGHGVFRGFPGLVCLAVDLITPGVARFPLVEA